MKLTIQITPKRDNFDSWPEPVNFIFDNESEYVELELRERDCERRIIQFKVDDILALVGHLQLQKRTPES